MWLVAVAVITGCGSAEPPSLIDTRSNGSLRTIAVAAVQDEGLVESVAGKVVVRRLDGTIAMELPGFQVDETSSPAHPPLLKAGDGTAFRLRGGILSTETPLVRKERFSGDGPAISLRTPPGSGVGHWRYAFRGSSGQVLAQWSGECEVPLAYEIKGNAVRGFGAAGAAVESQALGLALDGSPIVQFPATACGSGSAMTGVHIRVGNDWRRLTTSSAARYFRNR
jgi:hypothetical protein